VSEAQAEAVLLDTCKVQRAACPELCPQSFDVQKVVPTHENQHDQPSSLLVPVLPMVGAVIMIPDEAQNI
jgi:hypothetical protein